jgi:hypothetical protein
MQDWFDKCFVTVKIQIKDPRFSPFQEYSLTPSDYQPKFFYLELHPFWFFCFQHQERL